jgi:hypothetical protein
MRKLVVHMLGRVDGGAVNTGRDQFALCGRVGIAEHRAEPYLYDLSHENGGGCLATTTVKLVTCKKCANLLSIGRLQTSREERTMQCQ